MIHNIETAEGSNTQCVHKTMINPAGVAEYVSIKRRTHNCDYLYYFLSHFFYDVTFKTTDGKLQRPILLTEIDLDLGMGRYVPGLGVTYPAVPYDDLAVPDIFPSGTIGSPKNSITMMLIRHFNRCWHFHDQSRRFLRELWLCKITTRWPDLTHLSVHPLVNGVRSTRSSFLVRVIGSTATTVRKVSEVTKELKLYDYE